jgi:NADPH:quinone reductase
MVMRALVYDPAEPTTLALREVADPDPGPSEALLEVEAASVNFADVAYMHERLAPGDVPGFDAAGRVVAEARDGSGPPLGARVASFGGSGAWAELRAVDVTELAPVPEAVDLASAAAVTAAGVTALRALRQLGSVRDRRVLITGASGGVGRYAVQLAASAGAHVIASAGRSTSREELEALGAAEVVVGLDAVSEPVAAALDMVGGPTLAQSVALLDAGGVALSIGVASRQPTTIDFEQARRRGGARIEAFNVGSAFGADLADVLTLVGAGQLDPQIGWRGPWHRAGEAATALLSRTVSGKAVLEVNGSVSTSHGLEGAS